MANTLDKYKQIQSNLAAKKASGQSLNLTQEQKQAAIDKFGADKVNSALSTVQNAGVGINTTPKPAETPAPVVQPEPIQPEMPKVAPTTGDVTAPAPTTPEVGSKPQEPATEAKAPAQP